LCEEVDELGIGPKTRLIKRAEEWHDDQSLIRGVGEFNDIQQRHAMVVGVTPEFWRRDFSGDLQFLLSSSHMNALKHHLSPI
jgi:hypothetical protein